MSFYLMIKKRFSILLFIFVVSGCSSDSKDRKEYIEQCMYPYKAIKTAVRSEESCSCTYDTIREQYGKPFFNQSITNEDDQKRLDFARGYASGKCGI